VRLSFVDLTLDTCVDARQASGVPAADNDSVSMGGVADLADSGQGFTIKSIDKVLKIEGVP
jgi:hypothetical protein